MFCRYCGKEVLDEAYMCPSCGSMLKELPIQQAEAAQIAKPTQTIEEKPQKKRDKYKVPAMVLSIVAIVLSGIQLAFVLGTMSTLGVALFGSSVVGSDDWAALGWLGVVWFAYGVWALIGLSPFSTATGIIGFCFGRKTENEKIKKLSIVAFVLAIIVAVCAVFAYAFIFVGNV